MLKTILLLNRRRGTTPAEFRQYYEEIHAPLAVSILKPAKYVRNYCLTNLISEPYIEASYDCITELSFDEPPQVTHENFKTLRGDEENFIDLESMRLIQVEVCESAIGSK